MSIASSSSVTASGTLPPRRRMESDLSESARATRPGGCANAAPPMFLRITRTVIASSLRCYDARRVEKTRLHRLHRWHHRYAPHPQRLSAGAGISATADERDARAATTVDALHDSQRISPAARLLEHDAG